MDDVYGGVETGGTWCVCATARGPRDLLAREQFRTVGPEETLDRIVSFFSGQPDLRAIGIGAFGPLDLNPGSSTWGSVTSTPKPGWRHVELAGALGERLGLPVAIDTDVAAAGIAEARWGAGRGAPSLCYLTIGTGIGGALVVDGRPWRGLIHPEVGHLRIPRGAGLENESFAGVCPVHGDCWEGLASGRAIAERWGAKPEELDEQHPAWELEAEYAALGLLAIVSIASPHRIVVGGGVMERAGLLERVRRRLPELIAGYLEHPLLAERIGEYLVPPALGDDAGVLGAIALAQGLG